MLEIWKPIQGFEDCYEVSNLGNVRSLDRYIYCKSKTKPNLFKGKILKQRFDKYGYLTVNLKKSQKSHIKKVHRLVALAFIKNPNNCDNINHIDGIKTNNIISNLEWCTPSYNTCYSLHKASFKIMCNGIIYPSIKACARALNIDSKCIRYRLKVGGVYKGKYKFTLV